MALSLSMFIAFGVILFSPITPGPVYQGTGGISALWLLPFGSFAVVGGIIAARRPESPMGWLFLVGAVLLSLGGLCALVGSVLIYTHHGAGQYVVLGSALWNAPVTSTAGIVLLLFVFPDGRLLSPRWRWPAYLLVALSVTGIPLCLVNPAPGTLGSGPTPAVVSVLGIPAAAGLVTALSTVWTVAGFAIALIAVGSVFLRLRGANAERRHQIRWFAFAALLTMLIFAATSIVSGISPSTLTPLATAILAPLLVIQGLALPVGIMIAVLKYRLYDIDVVISRTLVYGSLAVFITAVYVGIAVGIGALIGGGGKPNLGLSILATAIVAVGFQPVRERVQKVANRLVYGKRATPYEVLSQFSERVAESYASDDVLPRMARVLAEGTNANLAEVWLRSGDVLQRAAVYPPQPSVPAAVHLNGTAELAIPTADRSVVVRHQGEVLGALTVTKRRGEAITPIEIKLMDDLAHQAGLVLKNVGLTADLQARLVDLRASRQRLVAAQDDERRRLERNLHDGAQQHLVALKVKLGLAEMLATRDPERARAAVAELKHDADEALETLRDLARGIYPPLLAEKGLPTALAAQARKATLPVTVDAEGIGRYPQDTEAALYFCILEALQNIQKYAQASSAVVRLHEEGGQLAVEVADDGRGFDVSTTIRGNGLTNMEDRLDALGGTLHIASSPGNGTTLRAVIPFAQAVPVGG
jgi:signal transduction histidine kinase